MEYDDIESVYLQQFAVCGWALSFDGESECIVITLNVSAEWEYYDEDFEDESPPPPPEANDAQSFNVYTPPPPDMPSNRLSTKRKPAPPPPKSNSIKTRARSNTKAPPKRPKTSNAPNTPNTPFTPNSPNPPNSETMDTPNVGAEPEEYEYYFEDDDAKQSEIKSFKPNLQSFVSFQSENAVKC